MGYEIDDLGVRIIGYNQGIDFYDPSRNLRCRLYLKADGTLGSNCEIISRDVGSDDVAAPSETPSGSTGITEILAGPDIHIDTSTPLSPRIGRGGDSILLFDSGGAPVAEFAASSAGLTAALAAMAAGDVVELPAVTITGGPWTVSAGTLRGMSRKGSVLDGQVTLSDGTALENLTVKRSEDDAGAIYGVVDDGGTATLSNVVVNVANATGAAYAVYMASGGRIDAYAAELLAETGSDGYAGYVTLGDLCHWSGVARGTSPLTPYWLT